MGQLNEKMQRNNLYDVNNDLYKNRYQNLNYNNDNEMKNVASNISNIRILDDENIPFKKFRGNTRHYSIPNNAEGYKLENDSNRNYRNLDEHNTTYLNELRHINNKDTYYTDINRNTNIHMNHDNTMLINRHKEINYLKKNDVINENNNMPFIPHKMNRKNIYNKYAEEQITRNNLDFRNENEMVTNNYNRMNNYRNFQNENNNNVTNTYKNHINDFHGFKEEKWDDWNIKQTDKINHINNNYTYGNKMTGSQYPFIKSKSKLSDIDHIIKKYTSKDTIEEIQTGNYLYNNNNKNNDMLHDILRNSDNNFNNNKLYYASDIKNFKNAEKEEKKRNENKINILKNIIVTTPNKNNNNKNIHDDLYDSMLMGNDNLNLSSSSLFDYNIGHIYNNIINGNNSNVKKKNIENNTFSEWNSVDKMNETPNVLNRHNYRPDTLLNESNTFEDKYSNQNIPNSVERNIKQYYEDNQMEKMKNDEQFYKNKDHSIIYKNTNINAEKQHGNIFDKFYQNEINEYAGNRNNKLLFDKNNNIKMFNNTPDNFNSINKIRNNYQNHITWDELDNKYNHNDRFDRYDRFNSVEKNIDLFDRNKSLTRKEIGTVETQRHCEKFSSNYMKETPTPNSPMNENDMNEINNIDESIFKKFNEINNINGNNNQNNNNERTNMMRKRCFSPKAYIANDNANNIMNNANLSTFRKRLKSNENTTATATINYANRNHPEETSTIFDTPSINKSPMNYNNNMNKLNNANLYEYDNMFLNNKMFSINEKRNIYIPEEKKMSQAKIFDNTDGMTSSKGIDTFRDNIRKSFQNKRQEENFSVNDHFKKDFDYLQKNTSLGNGHGEDINRHHHINIPSNFNNTNNCDASEMFTNFNNNNLNSFMKKYHINNNTYNEKKNLHNKLTKEFMFDRDIKDSNFLKHEINKGDRGDRFIEAVDMNNKHVSGLTQHEDTFAKENYFNTLTKLNKEEKDVFFKKNYSPFNYALNTKLERENKNMHHNNINIFNNFNNAQNEYVNNTFKKFDNTGKKENIFSNVGTDSNYNNNMNLNRKSFFFNYEDSQNRNSTLMNDINRTEIINNIDSFNMNIHDDHNNAVNAKNVNYMNNISNIGNKKSMHNINNVNNTSIKQTATKSLPPLPFKNFGKANNDLSSDNTRYKLSDDKLEGKKQINDNSFNTFHNDITNINDINNIRRNRKNYGDNMYEEEKTNNIADCLKNKYENFSYNNTTCNYLDNIYHNSNPHSTKNHIRNTVLGKKEEVAILKEKNLHNNMMNEPFSVFKNYDLLNKNEGSNLFTKNGNQYEGAKLKNNRISVNTYAEEKLHTHCNTLPMENTAINNTDNFRNLNNMYTFRRNDVQDKMNGLHNQSQLQMLKHVKSQEENTIFNRNKNSSYRYNLNNLKMNEIHTPLNSNMSFLMEKLSDHSEKKKKYLLATRYKYKCEPCKY